MPCDLILALDVPTREEAAPILRQLRGQLRWVKLGLQMFTAYGPAYVSEVAGLGFDVFLDLKLHDIPNTVAKAVESLGPLPIKMLTLHTSGGGEMMRAAVAAQQKTNPNLLLLGVTVLTSTDASGLNEIGITSSPADQVARLGKLAIASGLRGLVCSPLEVELLRRTLPASTQLVTPGIRPASKAGFRRPETRHVPRRCRPRRFQLHRRRPPDPQGRRPGRRRPRDPRGALPKMNAQALSSQLSALS